MQASFFSLKKEAVECTYSEYIKATEHDYRGLKHVEQNFLYAFLQKRMF